MYMNKSYEMFGFIDKIKDVYNKIEHVRKLLIENKFEEIKETFDEKYINENRIYLQSKLRLDIGKKKYKYCEEFDELIQLFELSLECHNFDFCILLLTNFELSNKHIINIVYRFYKKNDINFYKLSGIVRCISIGKHLCEKQIKLIIASSNHILFASYLEFVYNMYLISSTSVKQTIYKIILGFLKDESPLDNNHKLLNFIKKIQFFAPKFKFNEEQSLNIVMTCDSLHYYYTISELLDEKHNFIGTMLEHSDNELLEHLIDSGIIMDMINHNSIIKRLCNEKNIKLMKKFFKCKDASHGYSDDILQILRHENCKYFLDVLNDVLSGLNVEYENSIFLSIYELDSESSNNIIMNICMSEDEELVMKLKKFLAFENFNFYNIIVDMIKYCVDENICKGIDDNDKIIKKLKNVTKFLDLIEYDCVSDSFIFEFTKPEKDCSKYNNVYTEYINHLGFISYYAQSIRNHEISLDSINLDEHLKNKVQEELDKLYGN